MQSCMDDGGKKYIKQNFVLLIHVVVIPLYKVCNSCYYWLLGMDIVAECRSGYATITTRIPKLQGCQRPAGLTGQGPGLTCQAGPRPHCADQAYFLFRNCNSNSNVIVKMIDCKIIINLTEMRINMEQFIILSNIALAYFFRSIYACQTSYSLTVLRRLLHHR